MLLELADIIIVRSVNREEAKCNEENYSSRSRLREETAFRADTENCKIRF